MSRDYLFTICVLLLVTCPMSKLILEFPFWLSVLPSVGGAMLSLSMPLCLMILGYEGASLGPVGLDAQRLD